MIRFSLSCAGGHGFEGWFASSSAFDAQQAGGAVECPVCGTANVGKALMAPAISTSRAREPMARDPVVKEPAAAGPLARESAAKEPEALAAGTPVKLAANVPDHSEAIAALRKMRAELTANADYVGGKFAEEARRIHYGEADKRGIYGEASSDEVKALAEEGIGFHPLPVLPEDRN